MTANIIKNLRIQFLPPKTRAARNGLYSLVQSIAGTGTYFLVMRYIIEVAGLDGVGLWSLTMGFVAFIRIMDLTGAGGLARMVAIHANDKEIQVQQIDTLVISIIIVYAFLSLIAYFPISHAISGSVSADSRSTGHGLLIWAMISLPINVASLAQLSAIDGIGRADIRSILNIGGYIIYGVLSLVFLPSWGILGLAYAQFVQYVMLLMVSRAVLVSNIASLGLIPLRFSSSAASATLSYGFRLQISSIPMTLFDVLTRVLLGRWFGLETLGLYDLSYKLAGNVRALMQASLNPLLPEFAKLWQSDPEASRVFHARISTMAIRSVALAYSLLILTSPVFSLFLFSHISWSFIASVAVLSLGWGIASFGLVTQLFSRAAGILRWSITGQWLLLGLGILLLYGAPKNGGNIYIAAAVAIAIAIGHVFAAIGESRMLSLTPFGAGKDVAKSILCAAGFIFLAIAVSSGTLIIFHDVGK